MDYPASSLPIGALPQATPVRARRAVAPVAATLPAPDPDDAPSRTAEEAKPVPDPYVPRLRSELVSRVFNMLAATAIFIVTSPLMLLTAIAIKLTSRGPVIYSQTRVGIDRRWNRARSLHDRRAEDVGGSQFTIYKFRSMRIDAEKDGKAVWAKKDDDRCTPVGRFIRKVRLDELPQLWNVMRGDMNLVGPRPERPSIVVRLREEIELYGVRQRVKPGLTGYAQIFHSYDTDIEGVRIKLSYDLRYLQEQSMWTDIVILLRTIPVVFGRRGGW
jgi:lipopolysaccharide/colanic/teichoic acid biosynthesis glycosyltransferase